METKEQSQRDIGIPSHIQEKAEQLLKLFEAYMGPQAAYIMEDLVAMSLGRMDETSQNGNLEDIKASEYGNFSTDDLKQLLNILAEKNPKLANLIESAQESLNPEKND